MAQNPFPGLLSWGATSNNKKKENAGYFRIEE